MAERGMSEPSRRIALVTPEWTTTEDDPGAQALVTERIAVALLDAGWNPEVFTPADEAGTIDDDGIVVHRVARGSAPPGMPVAERFEKILDRSILAAGLRKATNRKELLASTRMQERRQFFVDQSQARALGEAVELRQKEVPFQAAISTDAGLAGLFVPARRSRPHIVRATGEPEAWAIAAEDTSTSGARLVADQRKLLRQAQAVYASCQVVADAVAQAYDMDVPVIRPPAPVEPHTGSRLTDAPRRYLLMCGPLDRRHGAETLAAALPMAWRTAPELTVVLAGDADPERLADWRTTWRDDADRVTHLPGLGGGDLIALAARAVAVVAPALADDLDEMAQQALAVGVPVITTVGAGTSELVESGATGAVVPTGSPGKLAEALADAWNRSWGVPERVRWAGGVRADMEPRASTEALLAYVHEQRERWRDA